MLLLLENQGNLSDSEGFSSKSAVLQRFSISLDKLLYMQFLYVYNDLIGVVLLKFIRVYHDTSITQFLCCRRHRYSMSIAPKYLDITDNLNVLNMNRTFSGPKKPDLWLVFWV
jgi:hypothetical protein